MPTPAPQPMILTARLEGAPAHQIGDKIWHEPLHEAIRHEAEATVEHLPARLLALIGRDDAVDLIARDMTAALRQIGDSYQAIDGVLYELLNGDPIDQQPDEASLDAMAGAPVVIEAIFQELDPRRRSLPPRDRPLERRNRGRGALLVRRRAVIPGPPGRRRVNASSCGTRDVASMLTT